jgi:hypothetical protein
LPNVENQPKFANIVLPSSGRIFDGWIFCKTYIGQAVGRTLDLTVLISGAEEQSAIQLEMSMQLRKMVINFLLIQYS